MLSSDSISFINHYLLLPFLALVAVCLRLDSQGLTANEAHADDHIIISSLVSSVHFPLMFFFT